MAKSLTEKHNLVSETRFHLKSFLLIARRGFKNIFTTTQRFHSKQRLRDSAVISFSESELWNPGDTEENWILTAGKIENLRIAAKLLNGIEVNADKTFSFWKQLGNPNTAKGYVLGREIREGCIVPTIAGGLCQLSNALYDAALKAGFEIIERHKHTKVIKGSLAEEDRDATVKWNYVDLRFTARYAFRIEVELTTDKLIVTFKGNENSGPNKNHHPGNLIRASKLNDCYSCGNVGCFKHPGKAAVKREKAITTFILDDKWAEYDDYIQPLSTDTDFFIVPPLKNKFVRTGKFGWTLKNKERVKQLVLPALNRAFKMRIAPKTNNIFSLMLRLDEKLAKAALKHIPIESTHLVVSQNLLPFLWAEGVFGGRTFDVLMNRLPMELLHQRLDTAHEKYPSSKTLNDFRASNALTDTESIALTRARHIITPHSEIADIFNNKSIKLSWHLPAQQTSKTATGNKILFPASGVARKGAYEMKRLAIGLDLNLVVTGKATEYDNFWEGVNMEYAGDDPFDHIKLVVYPAYIEHQPRLLLKAISRGIPVITTAACGLSATQNVAIIPIGDYEALKKEVKKYLN